MSWVFVQGVVNVPYECHSRYCTWSMSEENVKERKVHVMTYDYFNTFNL